jgi:hypothetical protein
MNGYNIVEKLRVEDHIWFIRIVPTDISLTLRDVFNSLSNLSWIQEFDKDYIKDSYKVRAEATIQYISANIIREDQNSITSDSGEYVVSELARKTLIAELGYSDIPLGEIIKEQKSGNPGFDFYTENLSYILLFGEAKYIAGRNAYGSVLSQIVRFEKEKRDLADILDIERFCSEQSLKNIEEGNKGFIVAFSSKETPSVQLVKHIFENEDFQLIKNFNEIIFIAVNL